MPKSASQPPRAPSSRLLADHEISRYAREGLLISDSFSAQQVAGYCYEFRVGRIAYRYDYEAKTTRQTEDDVHVISPLETVTITTAEKVNLGSSDFLLIFSKGSLFSVGLTAVSTAADPGFRGPLGITMTNLSARPVRLRAGTGFVKGSFFKSESVTAQAYVGQHGDATMTWPYPSQFHAEPTDLASFDSAYWQFLPLPVRHAARRLERLETYFRWIALLFGAILTINTIAIIVANSLPRGSYPQIERLVNLVGTFASILGLLLTLALTRNR